MVYSEALAERIRSALGHLSSVREQKMFGGISFMVNEKMCVGVYNNEEMMIRCDKELVEDLLRKKGVRQADMKGKPMAKGWLLISSECITSEKEFDYWIGVALDFNKKIS